MSKFAVLGSPIEHSLSPELHSAAFSHFGLAHTYTRFEVGRGGLREFLAQTDLAGISVTMPLKDEAFEISNWHDPIAEATRVVNTLLIEKDHVKGFNTDVLGIQSAVRDLHFQKVIVVGNGATARSAVFALREQSDEIWVMARTEKQMSGVDGYLPWAAALSADLVVSTIPSNATDALPTGEGLLFDVTYRPWPTPLAERWSGPTQSGSEMLLHQAVEQSLLFISPLDAKRAEILSVMRQALNSTSLPK